MNNEEAYSSSINLNELRPIIRQRRKAALVAFSLSFLAVILVATLLSPVYRSSATVLIEQQEIPQDLVRSTVTSFADQRIQVLIQRAMTFSRLSEIIKKYDLYKELIAREPLEQVVEKMREDIDHKMISADVVDPRSGRPVEATIAFSIAYYSSSPSTAQNVANELVSIFLEENLKNRADMAEQAEQFLEVEMTRLGEESKRLEAEVAKFKQNNLRSLPEQTNLNISFLERTEKDYEEVRRQIQGLEERKVYLQSQLSQVKPYANVVGDEQDATMTTQGRIRYLQNKYLSVSAIYSPEHPDVIRTKRELEELLAGSEYQPDQTFIRNQLKMLRAELDRNKATYAANHPDFLRLQRQIGEYEALLRDGPVESGRATVKDADNPAYIQLAASLESAEIELVHLKEGRRALQKKMEDLESGLTNGPSVEKEYRDLLRDLENNTTRYQEVKAKQLEAMLARSLEKERKGERFTLIEPPLIPERPIKPNRMLIIAVGLMLSIAFAAAIVWLLEKTDQTVRGSRGVLKLTGMSPLAIIPHIVTEEDLKNRKKRLRWTSVGIGLASMLVFALVHLYFMPLDVAWFVALRKFG